jgi:exonuclease SbcC
VQAILFQNMGCRIEKAKQKQFAVDLKVAENSVADSEKLLMNQTLISKCLKIKNLVEECKLTYEAQLGKVSTLQDNLKRINRSWQKRNY